MIKRILNHRAENITSAAILLTVSGFLSAILGLLRDRLLSGQFGASRELDIYYAAFKMPDLVVSLLISGGIIASFLPVFSEQYAKNKKEAWDLTNNALNVFLILSIILCFGLFLLSPALINLIVPGFSPANRQITVHLARIMFLSPILFGISNIFSSVLQYFNRFVFYAIAPIFYNLSIIFSIIFFLPRFGLVGLAYGVIMGAFLHCLIQLIPSFKCGFSFSPRFNLFSPQIKKIFALMLPRTISATASKLNIIVITAIGSMLGPGTIAIFTLSDNLRSLPIGIIGGSFAIASYSFFARSVANGKKEEFLGNLSSAIRQTIFIILPLGFLLFVLRASIVRMILGTGNFGWTDTRLTAACLGIFSLGIIASSLIPIIVRAFFALQDTKTPLYISLLSIFLNIVFCLLFVWLFRFQNGFSSFFSSALRLQDIVQISVLAFPLSIILAGYFQLSLLFWFLKKKIGGFKEKEILHTLKKVLIASVFMIILVYGTLYFTATFVNALSARGVFIQGGAALLVGAFGYILASMILKIGELKTIFSKVFLFNAKPFFKNGRDE